MHIFIDESGTLPDPKDKFITVCGVAVKKIKEAEDVISRILAFLRQGDIRIKEVKFYYAGQNTKRQFLSGMVAANFSIFVLIIDKKGRKIVDTPENFSILAADLINEMCIWYNLKQANVVIDKHFHRQIDQNRFNVFLRKHISKDIKLNIKHADSQHNLLVNIADMAAGSVLWKYRGKDRQFYNLIKNNIMVEKIINWPEIKRKSLQTNKKPV